MEDSYIFKNLLAVIFSHNHYFMTTIADSIIKKMTEKHFSHFKILAEKAKYSHIKFLYTSIFALTIDIVSQNAKSADSSKDSRDGLEDLLCYIETIFLVQ